MSQEQLLVFFVLLAGMVYLLFAIEKDFKELIKKLNDLINSLVPTNFAETIKFFTIINGQKVEVSKMFLKVSQKLPLSIAIADRFGNPAKVDGVPQWAVSDESVASLEVAEDGMSAMLVPVGPVGIVMVQAKADADMGEGVKEILGEMEVEMIAGDAETIVMSAGQAEDI